MSDLHPNWLQQLKESSLSYAGPELVEVLFNLFVFVSLDKIPAIARILSVVSLLESSHAITKPFSATYSKAIDAANKSINERNERNERNEEITAIVGQLFRKKLMVSTGVAALFGLSIGPSYKYLFATDENQATIDTEQQVIYLMLVTNWIHLINHTFENLFKGAKQPLVNIIPSVIPLITVGTSVYLSPTIMTYGLANLAGMLIQTLMLIGATMSKYSLPNKEAYQLFKRNKADGPPILTKSFLMQGLFQVILAAAIIMITSVINKLGQQILMLDNAVSTFLNIPRIFLTCGTSEKMKVLLACEDSQQSQSNEEEMNTSIDIGHVNKYVKDAMFYYALLLVPLNITLNLIPTYIVDWLSNEDSHATEADNFYLLVLLVGIRSSMSMLADHYLIRGQGIHRYFNISLVNAITVIVMSAAINFVAYQSFLAMVLTSCAAIAIDLCAVDKIWKHELKQLSPPDDIAENKTTWSSRFCQFFRSLVPYVQLKEGFGASNDNTVNATSAGNNCQQK